MAELDPEALEAFRSGLDGTGAIRIKEVRTSPLRPGGRTTLTLFSSTNGGRPHPRLQVATAPALDPAPPGPWLEQAPVSTAGALVEAVRAVLAEHASVFAADDVDTAGHASPRFLRNSVRGQRIAALLEEAKRQIQALPVNERAAGVRELRTLADEAFATDMRFDDADTGTYHSFRHDQPFVHHLEALLASLPVEGTPALALLPAAQVEAVRRQRVQATAHLDALMRRKYANQGVTETDIERTVGGWLIDRDTRHTVSEITPPDALRPAYAVLRIDPGAAHPHTGAWIRATPGGYELDPEGTPVVVDGTAIREIPVPTDRMTFRRAPDDPRLRTGVRFDWDGDGAVRRDPIGWISWAGHCDVKAILEHLGITLTDVPWPSVREYRSDTDADRTWDRSLLLEILSAIVELGSVYRPLDGSQPLVLGQHRFGGARNDALPDRLQLRGHGEGRHFRWPLGGRQEVLRVTALRDTEVTLNPDRCFARWLADGARLALEPNTRFLKTVDGDYNVIDVTGLRIEATAQLDGFDPATGYPQRRFDTIAIDLAATEGRTFLGTHVEDAADRQVWDVWLDHGEPAIRGELRRWLRGRDGYAPAEPPLRTFHLPLVAPLTATLSRETHADDPSGFQALLEAALRRGEGIAADTDAEAPVWNGVVTRLRARRVARDPQTRVERWQVDLWARYGEAALDWLVRRDASGLPDAWAALPSEGHRGPPDFLWQDQPDVGTKARIGPDLAVNDTMLERELVEAVRDPSAEGGVYVRDEHLKNAYEILFCGLGGYRFTVVHGNKRYGFSDEAAWQAAVDRLRALRSLAVAAVAASG